MSRFDDRLTKELERAARPAEPAGVFDEIDRRRDRRVTVRRMQTAVLATVVFAGSIGGVLVLNRAFRGEGVTTPALPPAENGPIVVSFGDPDSQHLYLQDPNDPAWDPRDHQLTDTPDVYDMQPAVSPDGRTVIFVRYDPGDVRYSIWSVGIDGADEHRISQQTLTYGPTFSPDGTTIALTTNASGTDDGGILLMAPDGGDVREVPDTDSTMQGVAWSPDGSRLAFASGALSGPHSVGLIDVDGTGRTVLPGTDSDEPTAPAWSPDGRTIAFVRDTGRDTGVWLYDLEDQNARRITTYSDTDHGDTNPTWSPNGRLVAFERTVGPYDRLLYVVEPDGSGLRRIGPGAAPAWTVAQPTAEPSGTSVPPAATLLVREGGPSGDSALLEGTLAITNGCVGVSSGGVFTYLLWPAGSSLVTLDGVLTVVNGSGTVASIGDTIRMGGGIESLARAEEAVVGPFPDACRHAGFHYWYVGQIDSRSHSIPTGSKDLIPGLTGKLCNVSSTVADFDRAEPGTAYMFERQRADHQGCLESGHGQAYVAAALEGRRYSASTGPLSPCDPVCSVIGTVDLNEDGVDEVLVATRLYYPTSPVIVQVYAVTSPPSGNPYLVAVVRDDGSPLTVSWGSGGAGSWDEGVTCSRTPVPTFTYWRGRSPDAGSTWNWKRTAYSLDVGPDQVVARTVSSEQTTTVNPNGPKLHMMCGEDISAG